MIEINLLPPQYRTVERTPLPVFLGLLGGLSLIGVAFVFLMIMMRWAQNEVERKDKLTQTRDAKKKEAASVDLLTKEIQEARGRIDTVLSIAESKVYWNQKLEQMVNAFPAGVWIDSLQIQQRPNGTGQLTLACNAKGTANQQFTQFLQALRNDTNFFYHFDRITALSLAVVDAPGGFLEAKHLKFPMTLPLRQAEIGGPDKTTRK